MGQCDLRIEHFDPSSYMRRADRQRRQQIGQLSPSPLIFPVIIPSDKMHALV